MTEPAGRPRRQYAVARIRLVNFHNFVDETVDVRDGGHLFLLGDNAAGKTTVLDALHYALSGGQELELNAAARIGGPREEGRTVQGLVLRFNPERGEMNPPGSIAYAVVELAEVGGDERLCFGVGTQATTAEARVTRWGLLHRGGLDELTLLRRDDEGRLRPSTRDELRETLGRADVFAAMSDYRKALADRLFDAAAYEDVCRFWAMAKAYREIVSRTRDFDALFARLLPEPDHEVFQEILRSLRELDELSVVLRELEAQRSYVAEVVGLTHEVARRREEVARYLWLSVWGDREGERASAGGLRDQRERAEQRLVDAERMFEERTSALAELDRALARAQAADAEGVVAALQQAERDLDERRRTERQAEQEAATARDALAQAERARAAARRGVASALAPRIAKLDALAPIPTEARATATRLAAAWKIVADAVDSGAPLDAGLPAVTPAEERAIDRGVREADAARRDADRSLAGANDALRAAEDVAERVRGRGEELPDVPGFVEALAAVRGDGIEAMPLFEVLAPAPGAAPERLAALEALLGDAVLGALIVPEEDVERARACVRKVDAPVRVATRIAEAAALPSWVSDLLAGPDGAIAVRAHRILAAALTQPLELGAPSAPTAPGDVELRGLGFRVSAREPRLVGAEARRRAHAERVRVAEEAVANTRVRVERAEAGASEAERRVDALDRTRRAIGAFQDDALRDAIFAARGADAGVDRARNAANGAEIARQTAAGRTANAEALAEALSARVADRGLGDLASKLDELATKRGQAQRAHDDAVAERTRAHDARTTVQRDIEASGARLAKLDERLAIASRELAAHPGVPSDPAELERYVLVTQRGQTFRSRDNIDERLEEARIAERTTIAEIEGDGSRGVRNLQYASRFGFAYDAAANRVEDRRQQPAEGVLAELDQNLAEQREVVGDKTREMMDKLVLGQLARRLREQVDRLARMVREINRLLEPMRFGTTRYQFSVTAKPERRELVDLVRSLSVLDESKRIAFRAFIDERLDELKATDDDEVPPLLDYRKWFDYRLRLGSGGSGEGVELTRELRVLGSGGEQGVPNYLLVLALAKLMFDNASARVRPLMFDEAFYGIDAGRRDELLRFATELGLQLVVASPDQDGATRAVRSATTLFVVKDESCDVHLAPYHFWNREAERQTSMFDERPTASADDAVCRVE